MLDKHAIFAHKLDLAEVDTPLGKVFVGSLNRTDGKGYAEMAADFRAWVVCTATCDKEGVRVFSDEDIDKIYELDGRFVDAVHNAALKLSLVSGEDLEELQGNSPSAP